jgi:hypothetical protein
MKISKDQWKKIEEINEKVKSLDPILKKRIVDIELNELFGDDFLKVLNIAKKNELQEAISSESAEVEMPSPIRKKVESTPTIKEYFDEKRPTTAVETVAVFGCYLEYFENKDEFTEDDISRAYYDARVRKPKAIGQALRDAKNLKGYLVEGSKRGRFRLSNVGENLVLHDLPKKG